MREIKFRAWVEEEKRMRYDFDAIAWRGLRSFSDFDTPMIVEFTWPDDEFTPAVLMQYTGLKDKNGKEIYEGDVVKILHGEWMSQHLGNDEQKAMTHEQYLDSLTKQYEVVFATDRFMGKQHIGYNPWETDQEGYTYTRLTPDKYGYIEVIGNIYENPELLTNN